MIRHNSHQGFFRSPSGPAVAGGEVTFRLLCDEGDEVSLRFWWQTGEEELFPMTCTNKNLWECKVTLQTEPGLVWYHFVVHLPDGSVKRYGDAYDRMGGVGAVYEQGEALGFQLTVYDPAYETPDFMQGAHIYQIFPDRFARAETASKDTRTDRHIHQRWNEDLLTDSDPRSGDHMALDFFGGTLTGIQEKLPYLKDLGVTVLYLNPIFKARSNHRYDTGDYEMVDPLLGTNEEFTQLCDAAHAMGLSVMLDGVFSHTGEDSRYFNHFGSYDTVGAWQGKASPYYDWYTFLPDGTYRAWWGIPSLPECRKDNETYQTYMFRDKAGIVPRWIHAGSDGWRLDVADELSMDFLRKLRKAAKKANPQAVVLGEVWEDASCKEAYGVTRCYCTGDTLDSVMNYPLREAILAFVTGEKDAVALVRLIRRQQEVYPKPFLHALMNLVGSHDRARVLNVLCGREGKELSKDEQQALRLTPAEYNLATRRLRTCVEILCALPGCPTIYYGDEAGLTGCPDPFCRRPFPWGEEDQALQGFVREKLNQRLASPVLRYGDCVVSAPDKDTLRVLRRLEEDYCVIDIKR